MLPFSTGFTWAAPSCLTPATPSTPADEVAGAAVELAANKQSPNNVSGKKVLMGFDVGWLC